MTTVKISSQNFHYGIIYLILILIFFKIKILIVKLPFKLSDYLK